MFTTNSLYRNYANGNLSTREYNEIHKAIDSEHTTTAWYESDNYTIGACIEKLRAAGKKSTSALMRKLATLA